MCGGRCGLCVFDVVAVSVACADIRASHVRSRESRGEGAREGEAEAETETETETERRVRV